eukprot:Gregarina_sp_Poly_1__1311@NODE_1322_length_4393_cov_114_695562_g891_i0_p1_GENE_NODE_1322_length_4393_cov_114_695562_g891_i0NODE_1322_length_4393_cov_114_695562_g891_i0_p1_ORF_typecomplete_len644_score99_68DNA_ligase_A_M/PF01068_21/6_6e56DNA_ligase_A_N/PF04675_14/1_4e30DNA_ligase_A_N/PF04675_14/2_2e03RNA_ligase/PF09414_10/7_2e05mRNA_cap_enzyme/PF01331_19/0_00064_NODE_1322_length_4393_cov_114_695562_g891_i02272158
MGHATSDENLKPTKDGRKRVSSQSTLTTDLVIFPNLKKAKISDEEDHDNSPSKEKLALKDSTDTDQTSALDAVGNAMKIEQDAIHELAGIGSHTRGSTRQDDKAFNPALVLKENWAYYTQKKGTEKAFQEDTFLFAPLANTWQMLEELKHSGTGSKKKAIAVLTNFFRLVLYHCPHEIPYAAFLCFHRVAPDYFGVEVGVGESILIKTICETYGRKEKLVKTELEEKGDLGEVAQASRSNMSMLVAPQRLTMRGVLNEIRAVAETKGANAQLRKRDRIKKLLISAVKNEPKFIIRFLEKNLRTGVKSAIVLSSLAFAFVLSPPEKSELLPRIKYMLLKFEIDSEFIECVSKIKVCPDIRRVNKSKAGAMLELKMQQMEQAVRQAYSQVPNIAYVVYHLLCGLSAEELREQCVICPGVPVSPMLAKPTKGLGEILDAMDGLQFIAEYKYDGERIQIHKCNDGDVRLFSRNMEVLDHKYPDVKEMAKEAIQDNTDDFIIDAEVVAFDEENGEILPFQTLSGRKRKDVNLSNVKIQVHLFVFDCLRHNGEILVATSLCNRKSHLLQAVKEIPNKLSYAKGATITDTYELENLLNDAIEAKTEGLIVKVKDGERSYYEPSKRSINWLKLKKDYLDVCCLVYARSMHY